MLFLQYHHIHTTFDTTICWITKSLWQCLTFMGILRLFLCVTATVLFVGFVVSRACFFLLSPLDWLGRRQSKNTLSGGGAELEKTRRCYRRDCAILQACRAYILLLYMQNMILTLVLVSWGLARIQGFVFLAPCNMKSAFSRAILPHCLYYLVTLVLFFAPNFWLCYFLRFFQLSVGGAPNNP